MTATLTLTDLAPVAELLAETGWTGPAPTFDGWTWHGHPGPGGPVRILIRTQGILSIYQPVDDRPGLILWAPCGNDVRLMIDHFATVGVLPWAHHSAAGRAWESALDAAAMADWELTDEALAVLASGEASGAGEVLGV